MTGVARTWVRERNFRLHAVVAVIIVGIAAVLQVSRVEWALLALTMGLVFTAELLNTAMEAVVDLVSPDYHDAARTAKDAAAGAVLMSATVAVIVGLLILGPPLWQWLRSS